MRTEYGMMSFFSIWKVQFIASSFPLSLHGELSQEVNSQWQPKTCCLSVSGSSFFLGLVVFCNRWSAVHEEFTFDSVHFRCHCNAVFLSVRCFISVSIFIDISVSLFSVPLDTGNFLTLCSNCRLLRTDFFFFQLWDIDSRAGNFLLGLQFGALQNAQLLSFILTVVLFFGLVPFFRCVLLCVSFLQFFVSLDNYLCMFSWSLVFCFLSFTVVGTSEAFPFINFSRNFLPVVDVIMCETSFFALQSWESHSFSSSINFSQ